MYNRYLVGDDFMNIPIFLLFSPFAVGILILQFAYNDLLLFNSILKTLLFIIIIIICTTTPTQTLQKEF